MSTAYDFVVVGAGITGASTAYHLLSEGARRVLLLERERPAAGGTGRSAAIIRQHYSTRVATRLTLAGVGMLERMPGELGESQLSSLLESVPGLASVLRSPVADAIVNMIRAGAGLGDFDIQDARELVQYATRRGLIPQAEGAELMGELEALSPNRRRRGKSPRGSSSRKTSAVRSVKKATTVKAKKVSKAKRKSSAPKKAAKNKVVKKAVKKKTAKKKAIKKKAAKKAAEKKAAKEKKAKAKKRAAEKKAKARKKIEKEKAKTKKAKAAKKTKKAKAKKRGRKAGH